MMIDFDDIEGDKILIRECKDFYSPIKQLKTFGDYSNMKTFIALFGQEEGERLWNYYVLGVNRNIYDLLFKHMNNEQQFVLIANIVRNSDLEMTVI